MLVSDIGQGVIEEVDLVRGGENFGWDLREGSFEYVDTRTVRDTPTPAGFTDPIAEYDRNLTDNTANGATGGRAVVVGPVIRDADLSQLLQGQVILSDFPSGSLFTFDLADAVADLGTDEGGGQGRLSELFLLLDENGQPTRLLNLINARRAELRLGSTGRADTRFGQGYDGDVFLLNKQDGTIRLLIPEPTTLVLLSLGVGTVVLQRRRRI